MTTRKKIHMKTLSEVEKLAKLRGVLSEIKRHKELDDNGWSFYSIQLTDKRYMLFSVHDNGAVEDSGYMSLQ